MNPSVKITHLLSVLALTVFAFLTHSNLSAQLASFDSEPINYRTAEVDDAVARLIDQMESGEFKLEYESEHGYLKSILSALEVPISSQVLVFSKTSMQIQKISPGRPRAIYFNDSTYVAFVQNGGMLEIGSTDAKQGPTFYSLEQTLSDDPKIIRDQGQCIVCHASNRTQSVPGYLVRSVFPSRTGHPNFGSGTYTTSHSSPFEQRWGGWYVTGVHGEMQHMGNQVFEKDERDGFEDGANIKSLDGLVSTKPYLAPHSDIVALMVLEHQTQVHNAITYASFETRRALHQTRTMNKILERDPNFVSESATRRINSAAERLVEHLLMFDEFQLTDSVEGTSDFADEFELRGRRDSKDRSLRDLNLKTRLFQYPCSFLIYSKSFDGLPEEVRKLVLDRLRSILQGNDESDKFDYLNETMRKSILAILRETKPEFAN